ncbi:heat-inducible transcriptional repressor HrcA [Falsarthrobacter nasiphocae]|uniref:heat-inducible transcriptional repressor HrcA n=1 Tax=Falsarthrobacter nasiphocae TaxID=189863 RepID=UPI00286AD0D8|nr:heat-inducible transcriptional repressor HrcA [Falsarthrobacter nasiphocae]
MPNERRLAVLRAIVGDYVCTREPVGSKALADRHHLGVSPATIRNDMAVLEEEGLITAPHTSAGRIPTDRGYRLFVDRISEVKPLSAAERNAIRTFLDGAEDLDDVMLRSVRLMSQLTQQAAMIQYPVSSAASVQAIEVVELSETISLVILVTSSGQVSQRTVALPGLARPEVEAARDSARALLVGLPLESAGASARAAVPLEGPPGPPSAVGTILVAAAEICDSFRVSRLAMSGTAHLARSRRDFASSVTPVLEALEEQVVLLRLLSEISLEERDLEVRIGSENAGPLSEAAVVVAHYGSPDSPEGGLGVIGPTRMDYAASMAAVRAVARYITRILHSDEQRILPQ